MIVCSQQLEVLKRVLVMICMMLVTDICNLPDCKGKAVLHNNALYSR